MRKKIYAWAAMIIVVIGIILSFPRAYWWSYADLFFAFMMAFCYLLSVYLAKIPRVSAQLSICAFVFLGLMVLALIGEYIAFSVIV